MIHRWYKRKCIAIYLCRRWNSVDIFRIWNDPFPNTRGSTHPCAQPQTPLPEATAWCQSHPFSRQEARLQHQAAAAGAAAKPGSPLAEVVVVRSRLFFAGLSGFAWIMFPGCREDSSRRDHDSGSWDAQCFEFFYCNWNRLKQIEFRKDD